MSSWTLYWITRLDNLQFIFGMGLILSIIALIVFGILFNTYDTDQQIIVKKFAPIVIGVGLISCIGLTFIPTTKEIAAIIVIPKVVNSESVQEFSKSTKELADAWIEQQIKDLKDKK